MIFELNKITHSPKNDSKRPLAVTIVTPSDEPLCDITDPIERVYRIGMSANGHTIFCFGERAELFAKHFSRFGFVIEVPCERI